MTEFEYGSDDENEFVSKSQIKRELQALKALGKSLIELPVKDLDKLHLPEKLYDEIIKAQGMNKGALKRQVGAIGKIIANENFEQIERDSKKLRQVHHGKVKQFHQLEQWRDELMAGDAEIMSLLRSQFEDFDIQYVRQLVRNANKEASQNKPPKSARLLFQYLKQCYDNVV